MPVCTGAYASSTLARGVVLVAVPAVAVAPAVSLSVWSITRHSPSGKPAKKRAHRPHVGVGVRARPTAYHDDGSLLMDGGSSVILLPQFRLGSGPHSNVSRPPAAMSLCLNQHRSNGAPFNSARWMYG